MVLLATLERCHPVKQILTTVALVVVCVGAAVADTAARATAGHQRAGTERPGIRVAITVDDLPGGGPEVAGYTHVRIVREIIATLQAHHVQHVVGFVVGSMVEGSPERRDAMNAWVQAGFEVGNHTYSHKKLDELGLDGYMQDILANRPIVDALQKQAGQAHAYFRFPYLEEGRNEQERNALRRFLTAQHYTLARVSLGFDDTDWADPYLRCLQTGDTAALETLRQTYLDNALAYLKWSRVAAREVFRRQIPQVLLLHANVPGAKNLDALLTAYEQAGVRFISLEEALAEPAYTARYDLNGGSLFARASLRLARPTPPALVEPEALLELVCRCSQGS
ncbi:MAG TPA: polysaccharide deacetylase family protein [Polyangiales bacterium]